jgi:hypothetical protein
MNTKRNSRRLIRFVTPPAALFLLSWGIKTHAQISVQGHSPVHMTTDWSNRHMVYSAPSSMAEAWRLQTVPRYVHQWAGRNVATSQAQGAH